MINYEYMNNFSKEKKKFHLKVKTIIVCGVCKYYIKISNFTLQLKYGAIVNI